MRRTRAWLSLARQYPLPVVVLGLTLLSLALERTPAPQLASAAALLAVAAGSIPLARDTAAAIRQGRYALDYIAALAILTAIFTGNLLVGAVITLMLVGGQTLEAYGVRRARHSLSLLADRIPNAALVQHPDGSTALQPVDAVPVGATVLVRHGEVVSLDGELLSDRALLDESSLTGEPYLNDRIRGDDIRSGTLNLGGPLLMHVQRPAGDSTYRRILALVEAAQASSAPMVRLANRYSAAFTVVALGLAGGAWLLSGDVNRALAVLVVATPCPLILATPIALMGGVNRAARRKVIVKRLAALEVLARVSALIFDKTGTITVGRPELARVELAPASGLSVDEALAVAAAVERHSLHPVAKALVEAARQRGLPTLAASDVREAVGSGIEASVAGSRARVQKAISEHQEMRVSLELDRRPVATFVLEDRLKEGARAVFQRLSDLGLELAIATGDRRAPAERAAAALGLPVAIEAECTPAAKLQALARRQQARQVVGMVGDGINDAPALARADVGLVFAHEAHTAASEAADVVLLGGDAESVLDAVLIARGAVRVATQGILLGIGLSVLAMLFAAAGYVSPLAGAFLQEGIDVLVIANALRATAGGQTATRRA